MRAGGHASVVPAQWLRTGLLLLHPASLSAWNVFRRRATGYPLDEEMSVWFASAEDDMLSERDRMPGAPQVPPEVLREYAMLADGERGALIGPRGDLVWMCAPRWDSDPVFSSMIGG
ncbi:MAG: trehalase-like domain-containing protein, partial [Haloechinothrix sp.]